MNRCNRDQKSDERKKFWKNLIKNSRLIFNIIKNYLTINKYF